MEEKSFMKRILLGILVVMMSLMSHAGLAQTKKSHHSLHHHSKVVHSSHVHAAHSSVHRKHHLHHAHHVAKASHVIVAQQSNNVENEQSIEISPEQSKEFNMENEEALSKTLPTPAAFQIQTTDELDGNEDTAAPVVSLDDNTAHLSTRERLVGLVHEAVDRLQHTSYRMGGSYFDLSRGIYEEDCSGYVDQLLNRAEPDAYKSLTEWTHSNKPNSFDYYDFFRKLPDSSWHFWQKVKDVARLKPGAILVFRYHGHSRFGSGGHVMVVMSQPVPVESRSDTFLVQVSDSAYSGHSDDTRVRHMSGVGIGTLLLKVNPFTREPNAYAWKLSGWLEHADVAMAEPVTPA